MWCSRKREDPVVEGGDLRNRLVAPVQGPQDPGIATDEEVSWPSRRRADVLPKAVLVKHGARCGVGDENQSVIESDRNRRLVRMPCDAVGLDPRVSDVRLELSLSAPDPRASIAGGSSESSARRRPSHPEDRVAVGSDVGKKVHAMYPWFDLWAVQNLVVAGRASGWNLATVRGVRLVSYLAPGFPRQLFDRVGELIGAEVWFDEDRSGPDPADDPFADGRADLGWVCSTSYVQLNRRSANPSVRLAGVAWVPDDPGVGGRPVYYGDLVVRPGLAIERLDDLAGHTIGCNDPVSLSGHHALRSALRDRGHDPDRFGELVFTGGHHRSLDLVADGALDAAVVDSVVRRTRARTDATVAALQPVERLGPWPVQPLVAAMGLDAGLVDDVRDRLLGAGAELATELAAAGLAALVSVGDDHYAPVDRLAV